MSDLSETGMCVSWKLESRTHIFSLLGLSHKCSSAMNNQVKESFLHYVGEELHLNGLVNAEGARRKVIKWYASYMRGSV
jgi:hypothetical protein